MSPAAALLLFRAVVGLILIALALYFGRALLQGAVGLIQAPAQLEAAIGNNQALKAGVEAQNKGVDGLRAAEKARKKKSEEAVKAAGKKEFQEAEQIVLNPAPGQTPVEKAVNAINRELGLK